ncbi:protein tyrosine phosphatase [Cupriavidus sp. USMAHM13]|uniref:low molecular weight protein-tyrosine-phosphatase n=1 Tax=Cupriavidus sp. USMAHM13 TaxID=1389192 RepID=UPI0008A6BC6E|nr:low molecular weight protein-tyrosine-phosphatase [Cupriavidus sp. USMAHM13]AOY98917.1 protein tyrosine phosphatase [Cupriavidus sp. USMAHM13]
MIKKVMIVCIGNICRSPMAEALLRDAMPELTVYSSGLGALVGKPADAAAIELMGAAGVDIHEHRAQQINNVLATQADLILVMDNEQKVEVQRRHPATTGKVFRLGEPGKYDIPDPYRQSRERFEQSLELIQRGVKAWVPRIRALG